MDFNFFQKPGKCASPKLHRVKSWTLTFFTGPCGASSCVSLQAIVVQVCLVRAKARRLASACVRILPKSQSFSKVSNLYYRLLDPAPPAPTHTQRVAKLSEGAQTSPNKCPLVIEAKYENSWSTPFLTYIPPAPPHQYPTNILDQTIKLLVKLYCCLICHIIFYEYPPPSNPKNDGAYKK